MLKTQFLLSVMALLVLLGHCYSMAIAERNLLTDQSSLVAFKSYITYDPENTLANSWSNSTYVCNWTGVACGVNDDQIRVEALNLSFLGLVGTIPPHLGNLSFLVNLTLRNNSFHGILPSELSRLSKLKSIDFGHNNLKGQIPSWLGSLPKIARLILRGNQFSGSIPASVCNLTSLEVIGLSFNQLSGSIPKEIGKLTLLKKLYLEYNNIEGSIPKEIEKLTLLKELYLGFNKIKEIPKEIKNLQLETLNVYNSSLKGPVPQFLFNMSFLKVMTLTANEFDGNIPDNICQGLPVIQEMYFWNNHLSGPIPSKLWQCKELRILSLGINNFDGVIPQDIGNLTKLRELHLNNNKLTGSIPKGIGNLQSLEILSLFDNDFSGVMPPTIFNISTITEIYLHFNKLSGSIPKGIGNLQSLEILSLLDNDFSGVMPSTIFNISTITEIYLHFNKLSGSLPSKLGLLVPKLKHLALGKNSLSGLIPKSISNASKLTNLYLSNNYFSGFIPNTLSTLQNLERLSLAYNNLTIESTTLSIVSFRKLRILELSGNPLNATLPTSIGNLSASLEYLYLDNCNLRGVIPDNIANLSSLLYLNLDGNGLSGSVPASIRKLEKLQILGLSENILQGSILVELCQLKHLYHLYLFNNRFSGSIPMCLGNLSNSLRHLSLASNEFSSIIPSTFWGLTYVLDVDLSSNSLTGSLSDGIGKLKVATFISISNNQLSGNLPSNIEDLKDLVYLHLENNSFEGSIPDSFGSLLSIAYLDLSMNNLSREIPKSLEKLLHLEFLNLSFNKLYGEIPSGGPFKKFSSQSFLPNYDLCGAARLKVPPCKNDSRKVHAFAWRYIVSCVSLAVIVVVVIIMIVLLRRRKQKLDSENALFSYQEMWRKFTHLELSRATDGFKEDYLLGNGSFGSVYKGILSCGKTVAIKVFNLELEEVFRSFDTECEVLCNIRHRNIVKVISYCCNVNFKALVLEYIPGGTLEKWLYFGDEFCLNFLQRLNIMIDVALALEYLHYGYSTPIVHCDLKPSNVLLDEDMVAHVVDFGIAKLLCGEDSMTQTMILATVGYMAPEYGLNGIVSRRGDTYSYGIMLMEVFTKKKPTDEIFVGEMNLRQWVENSFPNAVPQIIDNNLLRTEDEHYDIKKDCLSSLIELALACTATLPEERIQLKNILTTLDKTKKKFLMNVE